MNKKLILKSFTLFSLLFVSVLKPNYRFSPDVQVASSPFYSEKLIGYKIREMQLLSSYYSYLNQINKMSSLSGLNSDSLLSVVSGKAYIETEKNQPKMEGRSFIKKLGSSLNSVSMPFRRGIGKGFENFTSKVTGKVIPLALGCVIFWLFWGRNNKQSIFLPITTALKIIKPLVWHSKKEMRTDSSLRKFDTAMKHGWNWLANKFGKGVNNLVLDEKTNRISMETGLQDRAMALSFLLLANFLF